MPPSPLSCYVKVLLIPNGRRSRHPVIDKIRTSERHVLIDPELWFPGFDLGGGGNANGAPVWGAVSQRHVRPGYQACTFSAVVGGRGYCPVRLPRHASRGWSRVGTRLPCTDSCPSVLPFYWPAAALKSP
jgi:hypothetical protein